MEPGCTRHPGPARDLRGHQHRDRTSDRSIPNADAVETELQYTAPGPHLVPALDGMVSYIAQETSKTTGVTNKYYTTNRKHYHFIETYSPLIYQKIKR